MYRKRVGLTAQELAHKIASKHPDDAISAAVIFNIEAERKTAITVPELIHFAEMLFISPIQLLCDCDQPYLPAQSGMFQGKTAREVIEEFTLPKEARSGAPAAITTAVNLEDNLQSILNLGEPIYGNMFGEIKLAMSSSAYQLAEMRGTQLVEQLQQLQDSGVWLSEKTLDTIGKAWRVLRFFKPDIPIFEYQNPTIQ